MAQKLPEEFQNQMKRLLGEAGFFAYLNALDEPYTRALRINLLLRPDGTPPCAIEGLGAPVPWAKGAYFIEGDARPGLSPLHEGGLFYMQEPSALTAVTVLDPQPGERVAGSVRRSRRQKHADCRADGRTGAAGLQRTGSQPRSDSFPKCGAHGCAPRRCRQRTARYACAALSGVL